MDDLTSLVPPAVRYVMGDMARQIQGFLPWPDAALVVLYDGADLRYVTHPHLVLKSRSDVFPSHRSGTIAAVSWDRLRGALTSRVSEKFLQELSVSHEGAIRCLVQDSLGKPLALNFVPENSALHLHHSVAPNKVQSPLSLADLMLVDPG